MEISRLIFTKETKEKIDKGLSPQLKGKLRWDKLKEAENNGVLQQAKNRIDVGKIVGLENDKTAYSWVSGLISKKAIIETLDGFENNKPVYTYHLGRPLNYVNGRKKQKEEQIKKIQTELKRQDLIKKDQNVRELGKIKFNRLKKLDETGELLKATCRADVATLVGYNEDESKKGYSWVSNMIARGHLNERVLGITPSGKTLYEYNLTGTQPLYGYEEHRNRKTEKKTRQELRRWQDKVEAGYIPQSPEPQVYDEKQVASDTKIMTPIKIEITRDDITIKVELAEVEQANKLITTIMKGD